MPRIGTLQKLKSGKWIIEYREGFWPIFYTTIFPLAPWWDVDEVNFTALDTIVAFRPVLVDNVLHAELEE
jgi:hypothetical protein